MTTVGASGHRLRSWAVAVALLLSALVAGVPATSMEWPGSQALCADVAVTVAVNPDHAPAADLLHYRITAGHSHGPPATINGSAADGHTYYVLAGNTPVLVHNTSPCPSTQQLLEEIARRAERKFGGTGPVAGTNKHTYANTLLTRYQGIYGSRGLETEVSFLNGVRVPYGTPNGVRVDVLDAAKGVAYDYKFVIAPPGLSTSRTSTILQHVPGINTVIEINP